MLGGRFSERRQAPCPRATYTVPVITLDSMVDYRAGAGIVRVSAGKETELRVVLSFLFGKFCFYMIVIACSGVVPSNACGYKHPGHMIVTFRRNHLTFVQSNQVSDRA